MHRTLRTWMVAALAAVCTVPAVASAQNATTKDKKPMKNIVQVAVEAGSFNTLVAAVKAAGLVETLSGPGPFTVFAPTDAAFAKLPAGTIDALLADKEKLTSILTYHVVSGKVMAADIIKSNGATPKTVNGPGPESVSTRPAAFTAATSVLKLPASIATCTMFFIGFLSLVLVFCADATAGAATTAARAAAIQILRVRCIRIFLVRVRWVRHQCRLLSIACRGSMAQMQAVVKHLSK